MFTPVSSGTIPWSLKKRNESRGPSAARIAAAARSAVRNARTTASFEPP